MKQHKYPVKVMHIHHEFETAADTLLAEAQKVIKTGEDNNINKIHALKRCGFENSSQVKRIEPLVESVKISKKQIELINYYKSAYPLNKFITKEQVDIICKKYNLVCGPTTAYTGFVPLEKLRLIDQFKVDRSDLPLPLVKIIEFSSPNSYKDEIKAIKKEYPGLIVSASDIINWDSYKTYILKMRIRGSKGSAFIEKHQEISQSERLICAPKKDMKLKGLSKIGGIFSVLGDVITAPTPDPVVLQPVKGGFLIICAWGDEASDPIVVNEINN